MSVGLNVMVDTALKNHRKVKRLARMLDVDKRRAFQILVWGWLGVMQEEPSGDLSDWTEEDVAETFDWGGEMGNKKDFVRVLVEARWLDRLGPGRLEVHEWLEHQGKAARKRAADRERQREHRRRQESGESVTPPVTEGVTRPVTENATTLGTARHREVRHGGGESEGGKESNHERIFRELQDADIRGTQDQKDQHIRGWMRRYTPDDIIHLIRINGGRDIYDLDKVAFRDGAPKKGPTQQLNTPAKPKAGQVPCPFCKEMPGFNAVEGGLVPCATCKGSKFVDKVVPDPVSPGAEPPESVSDETPAETPDPSAGGVVYSEDAPFHEEEADHDQPIF